MIKEDMVAVYQSDITAAPDEFCKWLVDFRERPSAVYLYPPTQTKEAATSFVAGLVDDYYKQNPHLPVLRTPTALLIEYSMAGNCLTRQRCPSCHSDMAVKVCPICLRGTLRFVVPELPDFVLEETIRNLWPDLDGRSSEFDDGYFLLTRCFHASAAAVFLIQAGAVAAASGISLSRLMLSYMKLIDALGVTEATAVRSGIAMRSAIAYLV